MHRLFRWSEGHVLIIVEDASDYSIPQFGLHRPSYGDEFDAPVVLQAKRILANMGYYGGPMDGFIGPSLHQAIAAYQADHHLEVTGGLDAMLLQSIGMLGNASEIDDSTVFRKRKVRGE